MTMTILLNLFLIQCPLQNFSCFINNYKNLATNCDISKNTIVPNDIFMNLSLNDCMTKIKHTIFI